MMDPAPSTRATANTRAAVIQKTRFMGNLEWASGFLLRVEAAAPGGSPPAPSVLHTTPRSQRIEPEVAPCAP